MQLVHTFEKESIPPKMQKEIREKLLEQLVKKALAQLEQIGKTPLEDSE